MKMRCNYLWILAVLTASQASHLPSNLCPDVSVLQDLRYSTCAATATVPALIASTTRSLEAVATSHGAKFLSFEEWKAQNFELQQASETVQYRHTTVTSINQEPSPTSTLFNGMAVDSSIFRLNTSSSSTANAAQDVSPSAKVKESQSSALHDLTPGSKKERFNHASFDCAASIISANKESKGSSNILKENKDYYMLNTCAAPVKFVIVELCNDILIDSVQLANHEYFSGIFKDVEIQIAAKYPPGRSGWQSLGKFRARQTRDVQTLTFEDPLIWAKYIKVEMLTFYGNEFYCPLSLLRVFGKTMMEDYKQEGPQEPETENDYDQSSVDFSKEAPELMFQPAQDNAGRLPLQAAKVDSSLAFSSTTSSTASSEATIVAVELIRNPTNAAILQTSSLDPRTHLITFAYTDQTCASTRQSTSTDASRSSDADRISGAASPSHPTDSPTHHNSDTTSDDAIQLQPAVAASMSVASKANLMPGNDSHNENDTILSIVVNETSSKLNPESRSSSIRPSPGPHSSQESIYKQIAKRLSLLEANATLSLRYVESQSAMLAAAFSQLSSSHASQLTDFLKSMDTTMAQRIQLMQDESERLHIEFTRTIETMRKKYDLDATVVSSRLSLLTEDLLFFKRLSILQSFLMFMLLIFLVTTRSTRMDLQTHLTRALNRNDESFTGSLYPKNDSPASWRYHFRGASSIVSSPYSFPVNQIDRPDRVGPTKIEVGRGLGIVLDTKDLHEAATKSVRGTVQRTNTRSKDDLYDANLNRDIRRRLEVESPWQTGAIADDQLAILERDQACQESQLRMSDTGSSAVQDYPTPHSEDDTDNELTAPIVADITKVS